MHRRPKDREALHRIARQLDQLPGYGAQQMGIEKMLDAGLVTAREAKAMRAGNIVETRRQGTPLTPDLYRKILKRGRR